MGSGYEGDVAVPAGPGASFIVVQAQAGFEFAVVVFDAPADLAESDQILQGGVGGQIRQPVLDRLGFIRRPLGDQPGLREHAVGGIAWPAAGEADAQRDELTRQLAFGTLAPGQAAGADAAAASTCSRNETGLVR